MFLHPKEIKLSRCEEKEMILSWNQRDAFHWGAVHRLVLKPHQKHQYVKFSSKDKVVFLLFFFYILCLIGYHQKTNVLETLMISMSFIRITDNTLIHGADSLH